MPAAAAARAGQPRERRAMTLGNRLEDALVALVRTLREPCALEQLIGDGVERGHDRDDGVRRASARMRPASRTVAGVASDEPPNLMTFTWVP